LSDTSQFKGEGTGPSQFPHHNSMQLELAEASSFVIE